MSESSRLAGDPDLLQGLRASELLHQNPGRRPAGHRQAAVRRPDPEDSQGERVLCFTVVGVWQRRPFRLVVIPPVYPQGSVGAILSRKDDTDTQDLVCQQLGELLSSTTAPS